MHLGFLILSHEDWKWNTFDYATAITASISPCQIFSIPEASVQPQIFWFPTIHYTHPQQPHIILQKCLDGGECLTVLTVRADQLPEWESWTFVPPLLPRWLHEMTWATLNRKPSASRGYGCLSEAIHQAQKPDRGVGARPRRKKQGLSGFGCECSQWGGLEMDGTELVGTRLGGSPPPIAGFLYPVLTVLREPGSEAISFCQMVTPSSHIHE